MLIKARSDSNGEWGFLEKYSSYRYNDKGYVKALVGITVDGELSSVFIYKGDMFIPIEDISMTVGISKYIKAKKPFYSKVKECFVVELKAVVDYANKEYLPEESTFDLYVLNDTMVSEGDISFKRVLDVSDRFRDIVEEPLRILGESFGDREKFLMSRIRG